MSTVYDLIIIGAGPAGMTAAIYASRAELKTLLVESGVPGGKVILTPDIENWPGGLGISGPALADKMAKHTRDLGVETVTATVTNLVDNKTYKEVHCGDTVYTSKAIIIASGTIERHLNIPGEAEYYGMGVSYCAVCDGAFYRNRDVVVVGGGNTAFEDAIYLTRFAKTVKIVTRRDVARANKTNQNSALANEKIEWLKNYKPTEILGDDGMVAGINLVHSENGSSLHLDCDGVFPLVGLVPNTKFVPWAEIKDEEGFIKANSDMETGIPGIYSAGDVNVKKLRQIVTASADASIAAQNVAHYIDNWSE